MTEVRASIGECNRRNFIICLGLWSAELIGSIRKRILIIITKQTHRGKAQDKPAVHIRA